MKLRVDVVVSARGYSKKDQKLDLEVDASVRRDIDGVADLVLTACGCLAELRWAIFLCGCLGREGFCG